MTRARSILFVVAACALLWCQSNGPAQSQLASSSNAAANNPNTTRVGELQLPLETKSVRFAVIGDSGTGDRQQYEVANEMEQYREQTNFDFVIMLGDNIYGGHHPDDFRKKFDLPY